MIIETINSYLEQLIGCNGADLLIIVLLIALVIITILRG